MPFLIYTYVYVYIQFAYNCALTWEQIAMGKHTLIKETSKSQNIKGSTLEKEYIYFKYIPC